jgi:hypothetical protein
MHGGKVKKLDIENSKIIGEIKKINTMYYVGNEIVTKSVNNSVTKKFKDPYKSLIYRGLHLKAVVPPGIEPGTHGFSVRCSTN